MANLVQDLRYALRVLLKSRGFTAAAVTVLALGIGANSAIFSVVNAVLLRPMPYPHSDRLVEVFHMPPPRSFPGITRFDVSPANYLDWRAMSKSFDGMAAYTSHQATLTGLDRPETVQAAWVGGDFFRIVQVQARLGRVLTNDDDQPGRQKVAVISDGFWKSHFGSGTAALGRTLLVNRQPYTIIGVAPPAMHFPAWPLGAADIWMPLAWNAEDSAVRKIHNFQVVARMKPGIPIATAQAEMNSISSQLEIAHPDADRGWGAVVVSLRDNLIGSMRTVLLVLLGAVVFVLLIACANVANLITARNLARRKEVALRQALGAGRLRALQQLLSETLLLSFAGGIAGLALAYLAVPLLVTFVSRQFPLGDTVTLDSSAVLFTLAISVLTGILAGVVPAWRGSKADLNETLKQGSGRTSSDSGARRTRAVLLACEAAFSVMLLVGAGLMVRSVWLLTRVNPGFDPNNVLTLTASVSNQLVPKDRQPAVAAAFYDRVLQNVRKLPGAESAGLIDNLPFQGGSVQPFVVPGRPAEIFAQQPTAAVRSISPGYLRTMRIALLRGRDFDDSDTAGRPPVVLVSESLAKSAWPAEDAIGRQITLSFSPEKSRQVVGIVADVKQGGLDDGSRLQTLYEPSAQDTFWPMTLVVRTAAHPESLAGAITSVIQQLDPQQPVRNLQTMQEIVDRSTSGRRMSMLLLAAFAALALLLSAFGLSSVVSYSVRRRVREIGIRMALGATARDVLRAVAVESLRPIAAGIAIGLAGAFLLRTLLAGLLYGIGPGDPVSFAGAAVLLALVAIVAGVVPAWRATRLDPLRVLREE